MNGMMNLAAHEWYVNLAAYEWYVNRIVKSGKSIVNNRGNKISTKWGGGGRDPLLFENWIVQYSQPVCDAERECFVAMTTTLEQHSLV